MHAVEIGDVVFHWFSERHPQAGTKRGGLYAVSRVTGPLQRSMQAWEGQLSVEIPLTGRTYLQRPILLDDLKDRRDQLKDNLDKLKTRIAPLSPHSLWQFPGHGMKPVTKYLAKLTAADLELIAADHPHIVTTLGRL